MSDFKYTHGYSEHTLSTHLRRRADADAGFLVPHIKPTDYILDVGCGPGTITTGFLKYAPEGAVVGVDLSADVLVTARQVAADNNVPLHPDDGTVGKPGDATVTFLQGDVLKKLPFPDDTFDVVYCSQVLGHLPPPDLPVQALVEMRRVLKPGGVLGSRDGCDQHFYPRGLALDRLWVPYQRRVLLQNAPPGSDNSGAVTPALFRRAGFDADGGKVVVGAGARVFAGPEQRQRLAWRAKGQLVPGNPFYQNWINAGITPEQIEETLQAVDEWAGTEDAWLLSAEAETLGWK
ncbi:hypothetical protein SBRCBS47491_000888 [Sporothrix bragantina]|uniref:Methyltransferase type 11 domain-containing protein n=1 Tax=Sporothrix bragantina TaxID=671064 RepID=A0ABP0AU11_9PEZI